MKLTKKQLEIILNEGFKNIGNRFSSASCDIFVKKIYQTANLNIELSNCEILSFQEIFEENAIGQIIFLKRKKTKAVKKITHLGIIFPKKEILHYSRWMNGDPGFYRVFLSSFEEVFRIYDFVLPLKD